MLFTNLTRLMGLGNIWTLLELSIGTSMDNVMSCAIELVTILFCNVQTELYGNVNIQKGCTALRTGHARKGLLSPVLKSDPKITLLGKNMPHASVWIITLEHEPFWEG